MSSAAFTTPKTITIELKPQEQRSLQRIYELSGRDHTPSITGHLKQFLQQELEEIQGIAEALEQANNGELVEGERVHQWMNSLCTDNPLPMPTFVFRHSVRSGAEIRNPQRQ